MTQLYHPYKYPQKNLGLYTTKTLVLQIEADTEVQRASTERLHIPMSPYKELSRDM